MQQNSTSCASCLKAKQNKKITNMASKMLLKGDTRCHMYKTFMIKHVKEFLTP